LRALCTGAVVASKQRDNWLAEVSTGSRSDWVYFSQNSRLRNTHNPVATAPGT